MLAFLISEKSEHFSSGTVEFVILLATSAAHSTGFQVKVMGVLEYNSAEFYLYLPTSFYFILFYLGNFYPNLLQ